MSHTTIKNLPYNIRFYILCMSICVSGIVISGMRIIIANDQLYVIRVEQIFGLLAVLYWYVALLISPISKIFTHYNFRQIIFARRAIGVSAAYFALLHGGFALWGQLSGFSGLFRLPDTFQQAILFGTITFVILLLMAATSFNVVIAFMTPKRWKMLHRLGYIGGVFLLLHAWLIGTHIQYPVMQICAIGALAVLFLVESLRTADAIGKKHPDLATSDVKITIVLCLWLFCTGLVLALPQVLPSYHGGHTNTHTGSAHE